MRRERNLNKEELNQIAQFMLEGSSKGKAPRGRIALATSTFGVDRSTVSRIWKRAREQLLTGKPISLANKKSLRPQGVISPMFDEGKLKQIKFKDRGTIRDLATGMGTSKSTVGRWIKQGLIRPHTSAIKPFLTEQHKLGRIKFCLKVLKVNRVQKVIKFKSMHQIVHIDEKLFNLTKATERYYLLNNEQEPHRTCQSKHYIGKIMFLCAVARPVYGDGGECIFDGKIGLFPFTEQVPAKRKSKNREAGTVEIRPMLSVTKEVTKNMLINQIIPTIKAKWPQGASKEIFIQQDNATPHGFENDPDWREAATTDGFKFHLVFQPPKSPDTNINDLGWFRALQSLQLKKAANQIDDLLDAVKKSFEELSHIKLNANFLTLQSCFKEIIRCKGGNEYRIPHMGKEALLRAAMLPTDLHVELDLVQAAVEHLIEKGDTTGLEELIEDLEELV